MRKKILVIDDDEAIVDALRLMLQTADYDVMTSTDGKILSSMKTDFPDVILLDIWMSGIDGRDISRYIKKSEVMKHIPVIMISANKDTEKIAREEGADDFLSKPFDMQELLDKVSKHAGSKSTLTRE